MKKITFTYFRNCTSLPEISDLVSLGILSKPISEYTTDDIGSIISIPYNDESGKISVNEYGNIEFEIVGINYYKDINDESKPTITLMTKNVIRLAAYDAREPNNLDFDRDLYGNNRWSVSNIRQWLNSEGKAGKWFTKQHDYDEAPTVDKVEGESGAYAADPGFLTGFSDEIKQHFATVKNKTILCNFDKSALSKDFEETNDKVWLPSMTELGFGNLDSKNPEGNKFIMFKNNSSRIKQFNGTNSTYLIRTPYRDINFGIQFVAEDRISWSIFCLCSKRNFNNHYTLLIHNFKFTLYI